MALINEVELVLCSVETQAAHPELFHYTSSQAFESIVTSNTFWASHYRDMADTQEVLLLRDALPAPVAGQFDAILTCLNQAGRDVLEESGGTAQLARDFVNSLYGATFDGQATFGALDAFLVSFSTHARDDEFVRVNGLDSQWARYASPDGLCIVLDTTAFAQHLGLEADARYWIGPRLDPVRYADAAIEELFPELVAESGNTLRRFLAGVEYPEMGVPEFLAGATLLKGADFRSEREVRVVAISGNQALSDQAATDHPSDFTVLPLPAVRQRPGGRRYVTLFESLGLKLPIKRVIVGPSTRQEENVALARSLLPGVEVVLSNCALSQPEPSPPTRPACGKPHIAPVGSVDERRAAAQRPPEGSDP
jgi:hypothetical protein